MEAKKVLIIDDDLFLTDLYSLELQRAGFQVTTANGPEEGLSKMALEKPNLLLLDIAMPVMNGIQVLEKIRQSKDYASVKVLLLTNLRDDATIRQGLSKGADGYLLKTSLTPEQVVTEVKRALN